MSEMECWPCYFIANLLCILVQSINDNLKRVMAQRLIEGSRPRGKSAKIWTDPIWHLTGTTGNTCEKQFVV